MKIAHIAIGLLIVAASYPPLQAYEVPVHREITDHAFERLTIDFRARLGVDASHTINDRELRKLLGDGSVDEDDLPRPLNHFFDPTRDVPLTTRFPYGYCSTNGMTARFWALGESPNAYSIFQARHYYRSALVGPTAGARDINLRELFLSLGHLVHLLQDMAQPEHTRNDQHLPASNLLLGNGTAASIWEGWGEHYLVTTIDAESKQPIPPVV